MKPGFESGSNGVNVFFGGCCDVRNVGNLSRQSIADADGRRCIEFFSEVRSSIGIGIRHDGNSSTNPSHGISVPSAHHSGTDDGRAALRTRHETVADATDSGCDIESSWPIGVRRPVAAAE